MDGLGAFPGIDCLHLCYIVQRCSFFFVTYTSAELMQITYTSDYFQNLYDLAVQLIQRGHAYVDHQVKVQL